MLINEIITPYTLKELTTYHLVESSEDWEISQTSAFKKGFRKHSRDTRVMQGYEAIMDFIKNSDKVPSIADYPPQYNVHQIRKDKRFERGSLWAHLKGQKIGLLFTVEPGKIDLIHLGTHQELGWN